MDPQKPKIDSAFVDDVWTLLKPYLPAFVQSIGWTVFMQILALVEPLLVMAILNDIVKNGMEARARVLPFAGMAYVMLLVTTKVKNIKDNRLVTATGLVHDDIPQRCHAKLLRLPLSFHHREQAGELVSAVHKGAMQLENMSLLFFYEVLPVAAQAIIVFTVAMFLHWTVAAIVGPSVLLYFFILFYVKHKWADARKARHKVWQKAERGFAQSTGNVMTVQAFGREKQELEAVRGHVEDYRQRFMQEHHAYQTSNFLRNATLNFGRMLVIVCCASLLFLGNFSIGQIVFASMITERLVNSCFTLGGTYDKIIDAVEPIRRLRSILEMPEGLEEPEAPETVPTGGVGITFEHVSFTYGGEGSKPALSDISLRIEPGQMVGIVGGSGHGKSTLMKLLLRFMDPQVGTIRIGVENIRNFRKDELRRMIGYVSQHVELFDGTIAENIRYGKPEATKEEVVEAAKLADAHEFIRQLEQGYDTTIGTNGHHLSGGQRQRLGIARALLLNPQILIFDEATSSVDPTTIARITRAMGTLRRGRTFIVATHQISTIQDANVIIVMKDGNIHGVGTHLHLLKTDHVYREFVLEQQRTNDALRIGAATLLS